MELLNHILTQDSARNTSQSVRLTFSALDNIDGKSRLFEKRESLRPRLELAPPTISIDSVKKEEILKSPYEDKVRHAVSNYEPKKYVFEKKPNEVKQSVYFTTKIKSEKTSLIADPRPPIRQNSQLFEP